MIRSKFCPIFSRTPSDYLLRNLNVYAFYLRWKRLEERKVSYFLDPVHNSSILQLMFSLLGNDRWCLIVKIVQVWKQESWNEEKEGSVISTILHFIPWRLFLLVKFWVTSIVTVNFAMFNRASGKGTLSHGGLQLVRVWIYVHWYLL